jgi:hypothetical protein
VARIRTIKPEFWKHEELCALPEATHILAAALLNYADDFGYFNANPALVKAECSPLREPSVSIPESLRSLQEMGYLAFGTCPKGKRYGRIVSFDEHQRVSHPSKSKIAEIAITWNDSGKSPEEIGNPPETLRPEQGTGNREQGTGKGEGAGAPNPLPKKPKGKKITLAEYIDQQTLAKAKLIPEDHAVVKYAEQVGIPPEFLHLAWQKFKTRYTSGDNAQKKYIDWPAVFDNAVRDNWMKVWFIEAGIYKLTTVGQQAELARKSSVQH